MRRANPTKSSRRVAETLREAGFPLVVEAVSPVDRSGGVVLDAIAYDILDGQLQLAAAAATASAAKGLVLERALSDLATARDVLGTTSHYVVVDGEWMVANPGLTSVTPLAQPAPASARRYDRDRILVRDEYVLTELLRRRLWGIADTTRGAGFDVVAATSDLLEDLAHNGLHVGPYEVEADRATLWAALVATVRGAAERQRHGAEHVSSAAVANAVAELLGPLRHGDAYDPFCGVGSFLWAVGSRARHVNVDIQLSGQEIGSETARLAAAVASFSPSPIAIEMGDSFRPPTRQNLFRYIVSAPPIGMRLNPDQLPAGLPARRSESAAIALAAEALVANGRAVLHLPNSWLFNGESAPLREALAREFSVLAIVGLPSGSVPGTGIPSNLLVFDKRTAPVGHETFIAQLGEDWAEQLAPNGGALGAYRSYLEGLALT